MNLQQFKYLSPREKEFVLKTKAVFVAAMQDGRATYNLFQVGGFYLEVECNGRDTSSLSYFEEMNLLDPYLAMINIDFIYRLLGYSRLT